MSRVSKETIQRINKDLQGVCELGESSGCFACRRDDSNLLRVDALIVGADDGPYCGGLFHFSVEFPHDYPNSPPRVLILTTGGGTVRFNPNLVRDLSYVSYVYLHHCTTITHFVY